MERQGHGAVLAVVGAFAFPVRDHFIDLSAVQGNEAETMGDELIGKDGGVGLNLDKIDGHGGDFGEYGTAEGVGKGEVDIFEGEVDGVSTCLGRYELLQHG